MRGKISFLKVLPVCTICVLFVFTPFIGLAQITADFTGSPRSGEAPLTVTFTDQSSGNIFSWNWSFPGGSPSTETGQGPHTVVYHDTGTFDVTLTVYGPPIVLPQPTDTKTRYGYITVAEPEPKDFGDAPDDSTHHYATLLANDGAYHIISDSIYLGLSVDAETDGQPHSEAEGDDLRGDDEDGVVIPPLLVIGDTAEIKVTAHGDGYLNAWVDFNQDGDWLDVDEHVFNAVPLSGGTHTLAMEIIHTTVAGTSFARFRFSTDPNLPYYSGAINGEVEDVMVNFQTITQAFLNDSLALVALYNSTDGPNWDVNTNWLTGNLDTWDGVSLISYTGGKRVRDVDLSGNNLTGTLPPEIGNLTDLTHLDLVANQLSGSIPVEIGNLSNLEVLEIWNNQLSGSIPAEIGNLTQLTFLYISNNNLSGSIPVELGNLTQLTWLSLSSNNFTPGPIPVELGNLLNLGILWLQFTQRTGTIPLEICNLTNLDELILSGNQLTGSIPPEIDNLTNLEYLNLGWNQLSGSIPIEIGNLMNLEVLMLPSNNLSGSIPVEIGNLTNLRSLSLSHNQLSGQIPADIGNLTNLEWLFLHHNQLSGSIPVELGNLLNLTSLNLASNQLTGTIPLEICNLTNLANLILIGNQLSGSIPADIGNLTQLTSLGLGKNPLTGQIPTEIGNLINLTGLNLDSTQITDPIPVEIGNLINLEAFSLKDNQFTELPDLSLLTNLHHLYIEENRFTFEDIEPNIGISNFTYSPQDSVGTEQTINLSTGATLSLLGAVGGTANQYQWTRNGMNISGATNHTFLVGSVTVADAGDYICQITNTIATALTLYSRPFHVIVDGQTGVEPSQAAIPKTFALKQNYPNPFNPTTQIEYHLPEPGEVTIVIYDLIGKEVCQLVNTKKQAGIHLVSWDGQDAYGNAVASGIYFYRIDVRSNNGPQPSFSQVRKMTFMK